MKYKVIICCGKDDCEYDLDRNEEVFTGTKNIELEFSMLEAACDYILCNFERTSYSIIIEQIDDFGATLKEIFSFSKDIYCSADVVYELDIEEAELINLATKWTHYGALQVSTASTSESGIEIRDLTVYPGPNKTFKYLKVGERNLVAEINELKRANGLPYTPIPEDPGKNAKLI